ncbi:MAG: helix-turn-helix domain-containing protein [Candidatus Eremiobacteraeota bacterium]|nr:helix-turn-helix domain-containing protein [Candidatus Eremiobacteraeota bacterium]
MPRLGDEFRAAREARHLSLSDVSEQIHIRSVYLESIEQEDWSAIAAPVYVRGFIRTYARFLGLDAERAVAGFNASLGDVAPKVHESSFAASTRSRGPSPWIWLGTAVAVLLVAFVAYEYVQFSNDRRLASTQTGSSDASPEPTTAAAAPAPATPLATPKPVRPKTRTLEVRLTQASWLLVRIDGAQAVEGIFPAGTRKAFHGRHADVRAGNAGGVDLRVNGKELGKMGHPGDVVERTFALAAEE